MSYRLTFDVLKDARTSIERGWTQGASARDKYGDGCSPEAAEACMWCLTGAVSKAAIEYARPRGMLTSSLYNKATDLLRAALDAQVHSVALLHAAPSNDLVRYNDLCIGVTKADILKLIDAAIDLCSERI